MLNINWTVIASSTSDGVATQTKCNKLINDLKDHDKRTYGVPDTSLKELITGMHLCVLRKAQNAYIHEFYKDINNLVDN